MYKPVMKILMLKEIIKEEEKTKSGIILQKEIPKYGAIAAEVMRIGVDVEIKVKVGDKVIAEKEHCKECELDGAKVLFCNEDDILAVEGKI